MDSSRGNSWSDTKARSQRISSRHVQTPQSTNGNGLGSSRTQNHPQPENRHEISNLEPRGQTQTPLIGRHQVQSHQIFPMAHSTTPHTMSPAFPLNILNLFDTTPSGGSNPINTPLSRKRKEPNTSQDSEHNEKKPKGRNNSIQGASDYSINLQPIGLEQSKVVYKISTHGTADNAAPLEHPKQLKIADSQPGLWFRSTAALGINIWDALPHGMEVGSVGAGLNWPWKAYFIEQALIVVHCPAFNQNIPMLQYALRYAVAARCGHALPIPTTDVQSITVEPEEEEASTDMVAPITSTITITTDVLNDIFKDLVDAGVGCSYDTQNQRFIDKRQSFEIAFKAVFDNHIQMPSLRLPSGVHSSAPVAEPLLNFLCRYNFAHLNTKKDNCLLRDDIVSIIKAWDQFAINHNMRTCMDSLDEARKAKTRYASRANKDKEAHLNRMSMDIDGQSVYLSPFPPQNTHSRRQENRLGFRESLVNDSITSEGQQPKISNGQPDNQDSQSLQHTTMLANEELSRTADRQQPQSNLFGRLAKSDISGLPSQKDAFEAWEEARNQQPLSQPRKDVAYNDRVSDPETIVGANRPATGNRPPSGSKPTQVIRIRNEYLGHIKGRKHQNFFALESEFNCKLEFEDGPPGSNYTNLKYFGPQGPNWRGLFKKLQDTMKVAERSIQQEKAQLGRMVSPDLPPTSKLSRD